MSLSKAIGACLHLYFLIGNANDEFKNNVFTIERSVV